MSKGFFIAGTDTGVGKTIVAGAMIKALSFLGHRVGAMKPVESGCCRKGDVLVPSDGIFLKQTAHMDEPISIVTPCCFESPLAPMPASEIEQKKVDVGEIKRSFKDLSARYSAMIVEGLGGLMVPISKDYYLVDMAGEFGLPLLLVARPGLGTINHTMLSVICAVKEGLEVAGVIINYSSPPDGGLAEKTNPGLLARICPAPIIGIFPYLSSLDEDSLTKTAIKNLDIEALKKHL